ncbi:MAG: PQQ-dependent sugar dehydrogenase [Caldimonas sp.]
MTAARAGGTSRRAFVAAALAATVLAVPTFARGASYATAGTCAGLPRVDLVVPAGWCVALVADASDGLLFPRRVLEVAPGRFWLVDMGSWEPRRGRLLQFDLPSTRPVRPVALTVIADRLDRPLGLASGPDGKVYVGEAGRIWRTQPALPLAPETVLDHLPDDGAHPLKEIAFAPGGRMFVNVGSSSDACRDAKGALPLPCPDLEGPSPRAAVYQALLGGPASTVQSFKPYATGLRNSLALAWVASPGVLLQGENSIDYRDEDAPNEELNRVVAGANYGWPYCVGAKQVARGYEGRADCAKTEAPARLWPAHAAPLQMLAVPAGAKNAFAGQLVVAWHGYRVGGHRIASFALDASGRPTGAPRVWVDGWSALGKGHPLGAPAGFTIDGAGRMLVVDDRNRSLLMLVRDPAPSGAAATIR